MKALVVGQGGREHALVRALNQSESVKEVFAIPGSSGMALEARVYPELGMSAAEIIDVVRKEKIDLVVIGPEVPLVEGLADQLRESNVLVFGPGKQGAELEASKVAAKRFMQEAGVPTSSAVMVSSIDDINNAVKSFSAPYVLKADGLAAGKGVFICQDLDELTHAAKQLFEDKILGESGEYALLEEFHEGYELSLLVLTNGQDYKILPLAQDNKAIFEGNKGPNTGGMGTIAPIHISEEDFLNIEKTVVKPTIRQLRNRKIDYRGVIFIGLIMTSDGPITLEYNVRFGDPETQVVLPLLDGDWGEVLKEVAEGHIVDLHWKSGAAVCVVMAAEGYPGTAKKGVEIEGPCELGSASQYYLHAGTKKSENKWFTDGGRVLNAIGLGETYASALDNAYKAVEKISWPGMQFRKDIGASFRDKELPQSNEGAEK